MRRLYYCPAKRQQQINRMRVEAQGAASPFSCKRTWRKFWTPTSEPSTVTFKISVAEVTVPTREQRKGIGHGVMHNVQALLLLEKKEPVGITCSIKHPLTAVERHINPFCRVVYGQRRFRNSLKTALIIGVPYR